MEALMPRETRQRVWAVLGRLFSPERVVILDHYRREIMRAKDQHLPEVETLVNRVLSMSENQFAIWSQTTRDMASLVVLFDHLTELLDAIKGDDSAAASLRARIMASTTDTSICLIALNRDHILHADVPHYQIVHAMNQQRYA
jgi:hypothetical protein